MSIASEITRINTNIANSYTAVDNKNGTLPQVQNSANLASAINSIEVIEQATAEGESLSLTNIKAMPYSDYVVEGKSEQNGEPSPSNPSEIHSVADDVNLFDKEKASISSGAIKTVLDTGVRITLSSSGTYKSCGIEIGGTELLGKTITLYSKITPSSNNKGAVFIYYGNSSNIAVSNAYANITSTGSLTKTLVSEFPTNCDRVYALFYGNRDGTGNANDYVDYTNLKIQYGDTSTPYSPYNQGTVTIKQRGTTESDDYIIQTEPLRSLPNGVKDTMELQDMQNHTRIGRQTGTLTETTTITLSDAKTNGAYMCNIKPSGTLTGKTIELEAGDYEIIYELAEEIIEPLTQNQATTMLDIIKTGSYEDTTNIYTDEDVKPTMKVYYYKKA